MRDTMSIKMKSKNNTRSTGSKLARRSSTTTSTNYVVKNSKEALSIFRQFLKDSDYTVTFKPSRAKHASVGMVATWWNSNNSSTLDRGWFGRRLNESGKVTLVDSNGVSYYRISN